PPSRRQGRQAADQPRASGRCTLNVSISACTQGSKRAQPLLTGNGRAGNRCAEDQAGERAAARGRVRKLMPGPQNRGTLGGHLRQCQIRVSDEMTCVGYRTLIASLAAAAVAGCTAGSGAGLDQNGQPIGSGGTPPLTADFTSIQANVFTPICTRCHIGADAPQGLQLDAAHSYSLLVGVPSAEAPSLLRVKAGDPDNSYIIRKLEGGPGIVGVQMPADGPPYLPQATINVIRSWITNGATQAVAANVSPTSKIVQRFAVAVTSPESNSVVTMARPAIVVAFNHEVDASLVNYTTVTLQKA